MNTTLTKVQQKRLQFVQEQFDIKVAQYCKANKLEYATLQIDGKDTYYILVSDGRIWSNKTARWLSYRNGHTEQLVTLFKKAYHVSRLVAEHFIPNPRNLKFIQHIDGNRNNHNKNNLIWSIEPDSSPVDRIVKTGRYEYIIGDYDFAKFTEYPMNNNKKRVTGIICYDRLAAHLDAIKNNSEIVFFCDVRSFTEFGVARNSFVDLSTDLGVELFYKLKELHESFSSRLEFYTKAITTSRDIIKDREEDPKKQLEAEINVITRLHYFITNFTDEQGQPLFDKIRAAGTPPFDDQMTRDTRTRARKRKALANKQ